MGGEAIRWYIPSYLLDSHSILIPSHTREGEIIEQNNSVALAAAAQLIADQQRLASGQSDIVHPVASAIDLAARELSQWVGPEGSNALLTRAITFAAHAHPVLGTIKIVSNSAPVLTGVEDTVATNGASSVAAGLNATLVQLFELLVRVVGDQLTLRLAEQMTAGNPTDVSQAQDEEEEV
jgi:hypothetical protein